MWWFLLACSGVDLAPTAVDCAAAIDLTAAPADGFTAVLDAVALELREHPVVEVEEGPDARFWTKTGLQVRHDTGATLSVPEDWRGLASIGWSTGRTWDLEVPACQGDPGWLVWPGGYHVRDVACVPIDITTSAGTERVHVGVGAPCP